MGRRAHRNPDVIGKAGLIEVAYQDAVLLSKRALQVSGMETSDPTQDEVGFARIWIEVGQT